MTKAHLATICEVSFLFLCDVKPCILFPFARGEYLSRKFYFQSSTELLNDGAEEFG